MIIDFHSHCFPDDLAQRAIKNLEKSSDIKAAHDGTLKGILASMDACSIDKSVICNIATKASQFDSIIKWSHSIKSLRIIPFASVYPNCPEAINQVKLATDSGFKGLKIHPYFQNFILDNKKLFGFYREVQKNKLILISHTGYDASFPRNEICGPQRILNVMENFPDLKLVAAHFGSWQDWENVEKYLLGKPVYVDTSFALEMLPKALCKKFFNEHPQTHILFGTDSPWSNPQKSIELLKNLNLHKNREKAIFYKNAQILLN